MNIYFEYQLNELTEPGILFVVSALYKFLMKEHQGQLDCLSNKSI